MYLQSRFLCICCNSWGSQKVHVLCVLQKVRWWCRQIIQGVWTNTDFLQLHFRYPEKFRSILTLCLILKSAQLGGRRVIWDVASQNYTVLICNIPTWYIALQLIRNNKIISSVTILEKAFYCTWQNSCLWRYQLKTP